MHVLGIAHRAVIPEQRVTAGKECARQDRQVSRLERVALGHGKAVDIEMAVPDLHAFARKAHHAFDDQVLAMPGDHDVVPMGIRTRVCPFVDDEQIAGLQSGTHTVANNQRHPEPGQAQQQRELHQDYQRQPPKACASIPLHP
jgi:hypothetical protein